MTITQSTRHGHPTGYADGCRTNATCPNAGTDQMTCKDASIRYAGDWAYHRDVDNGTATTDRAFTEKPARKRTIKDTPIPTDEPTVAEQRAAGRVGGIAGVVLEELREHPADAEQLPAARGNYSGFELFERPRRAATPKPRPVPKPTAVPPSPEAIAAAEQLEQRAPAEISTPTEEAIAVEVVEQPKTAPKTLDPNALVLCQCSLCDTRFAILATLRRDLARRKGGICCPRGHWNAFPAEPFTTGDPAIEIVFPRRPS